MVEERNYLFIKIWVMVKKISWDSRKKCYYEKIYIHKWFYQINEVLSKEVVEKDVQERCT
jgi:hypothetical protein